MRVNINLATRPYEDVRQFLLRWTAIVGLITVLTGALIYYAASSWRQSRDVNHQISMLRSEMDRLDRERVEGLALLNRPDNRDTVDQAHFLNSVIVRKAFSWTRAFEDLEKMMPPRLHVVSMTPQLDENNQLQLHMMVAGDSRDRAVELVRRMEESPTFRKAEVKSETAITPGAGHAGDTISFEITTQYLPSSEPAASSKPEKKADQSKAEVKPPGVPKTKPGEAKQPPKTKPLPKTPKSKAQPKEIRG